jgi:hypothetical protein
MTNKNIFHLTFKRVKKKIYDQVRNTQDVINQTNIPNLQK